MKKCFAYALVAASSSLLVGCAEELSSSEQALEDQMAERGPSVQRDLARVRAATAGYHDPAAAQADGWGLVPGLDHCFQNEPVGAMGYHYINTGILDTTVDVLQPEAMVYVPQDGELHLGAVEYIVPAAPWDAEGHGHPPSVLGHHMHLNAGLGVYVLHAWIWRHNPSGLFEDWNPTVTCP